jgi:hypothetical protein
MPAGVYCASNRINIGNNQVNGAAFVAPTLSIPSGGGTSTFKGYTGLYNNVGGLLMDAYGPSGVQSSTHGASTKGAIFAGNGPANIPGGGTTLACSGANSCGFVEAVSLNFPGSNSTYQGLGPPIGGTVSTTATIVNTTTYTLPGTTTPGTTGTTVVTQKVRLRQ